MRPLKSLLPIVIGLLAACGSNNPPTIQSFTATPTSLPKGGGNITLAWKVSGASSLSIDPNIGPVSGESLVVNVTSNRTFTLTATNAAGKATLTASVTVEGSVDTTAPSVLTVSPSDGSSGVVKDSPIVFTFSEPMNKTQTQAAYQSSSAGIKPSEVGFEWNTEATVLTVRPNASLSYASGTDPNATTALSYAFGLSNTAADLAGNKLIAVSYSFKTLRQITTRVPGDPAQDGDVNINDNSINNNSLDLNVTNTKRGFLGYKLNNLPTNLQASNINTATLRVNAEFPIIFSTEQLELEHVLYGASLTASAATSSALRNLGYLSQETPVENGWKNANVLAAVKDDLTNRLARGNRSQYRLRCTGCSVTLFAAEAADSGGDSQFKTPELVIDYLIP